ncbi:uridine kinase [Nocardioides sp. J9]|uniref:ATP-binding protein n=1 Tax=Nocardioides sp. J9 TaxID=935844 RepID=UPI0011ADA257|nr:ATP-binding protein [Nocardioides sp. J9]TWH04931.1 uridine kinase [Nocardioides sp. J9]
MPARVIVLAGPSGAGKSRLAERMARARGWPTLRLDDFYRDGDEPGLPRITTGSNAGLVDWDHPATWHHEDALAALESLCAHGVADIPVYSISESRRTGSQRLDLRGATHFCAEGIFAAEVVEECRERGILAAAYCVTQHPGLTFWRRLTRDLREHRKPPLVLLRRGIALARAQRQVVRRAVAVGCRVATGDRAFAELNASTEDDHAVAG